jgi:hypothetical protein
VFSIKRRSAFVAHLRKHGMDPSKVTIDSYFIPAEQKVDACRNGSLVSNAKSYPPIEPVKYSDG